MAAMPRGYVLWEGASRIDGTPIVAIATLRSANDKTGDMPQVWILRQDVAPYAAYVAGTDTAVCGGCALRSVASGGNGACYVRTEQAPGSVWRAFRAGRYPADLSAACEAVRGLTVRIGAYGDPLAVPVDVWERLAARAYALLGYTHAYDMPGAAPYARYCMASVESLEDARRLQADGWRTFRIRRPGDVTYAREVVCPASRERDYVATCKACGLCAGTSHRSGRSVVITAHGAGAARVWEGMQG